MLRQIGAFLLVFAFLSLVVHLDGMVYLFGLGALIVFAADLLKSNADKTSRPSRVRREYLL